MRMWQYLLLSLLFTTCQNRQLTENESLSIAFGSCNDQDLPQPLWKEILKVQPDLWVWLGDNIYGDSEVSDTLVNKYKRQLLQSDYQKLRASSEILGIWDDHDYGKNDGGKEYIGKVASQKAFLDFFDVPENDVRRNRKGVYSAHQYSVGTVTVKIILLDARYHRDSISKIDGVYQPNSMGTVLGQEQWAWLEEELVNSEADIHILGGGIQFISWEHRFEKWGNFPNERNRLFNLIASTGAKGVILLSGDRHLAEVSAINWPGVSYPIRDITSSGLTHSYEEIESEPNQHRISPLIGLKNFGWIEITPAQNKIVIDVALKGQNDTTFFDTQWTYALGTE